MRPAAGFFALIFCATALGACGGGGEGTSSSSTATTASAPTAGSKESGSVSFGKAHPQATAATRAERKAAGSAAAFVQPGADNSVPTFGSEASSGERSQAEANLSDYLSARVAHQWAKACFLLAASVRHGFEKLASSKGHAGCAKLLPVLAPIRAGVPADPLQSALVAFRVHGANAFALFYGAPGHQQYIVPMLREAGSWRPTQAAPIAYPPGRQAGAAP